MSEKEVKDRERKGEQERMREMKSRRFENICEMKDVTNLSKSKAEKTLIQHFIQFCSIL